MNKPRIAFFTPLPPHRSGIADYSIDLLPELQRHVDMDLVVATKTDPAEPVVAGFRRLDTAEYLACSDRYDASVFQIGNSVDHHGFMVPCMEFGRSVVVLHDFCLQYLILGLTLLRGNYSALTRALRPVYGAAAERIGRDLLVGRRDATQLTFAAPVIQGSSAVIVHSEWAKHLVQRDFPGARVHVVPMGVPHGVPRPDQTARRRYGLEPGDLVVASISTLAQTKRLDLVLRALPRVRRRIPRLKYLVMSGGPLGATARRLIAELDLQDVVLQTGWLPATQYNELIALSDLVVDMRHQAGAETSASLMRALAAGRPAVLSAQGSFLEVPDACARKITGGEGEIDRLASALCHILDSPDRMQAMGQAATRFASEHLGLERMAVAYRDVINEALQCPESATSERRWLSPQTNRAARPLVAALYRSNRLLSLARSYGAVDTGRRIYQQLTGAPTLEASTRTGRPAGGSAIRGSWP
jgi:glycosyltransferase involved in cell wall biosynthesis